MTPEREVGGRPRCCGGGARRVAGRVRSARCSTMRSPSARRIRRSYERAPGGRTDLPGGFVMGGEWRGCECEAKVKAETKAHHSVPAVRTRTGRRTLRRRRGGRGHGRRRPRTGATLAVVTARPAYELPSPHRTPAAGGGRRPDGEVQPVRGLAHPRACVSCRGPARVSTSRLRLAEVRMRC